VQSIQGALLVLNTQWQKDARRIRTDRRDMERAGWEYVGEGGGKLWELERGYRIGYQIVDVRIAATGRGLWVRIEDKVPA
jgi:hypothetical protein